MSLRPNSRSVEIIINSSLGHETLINITLGHDEIVNIGVHSYEDVAEVQERVGSTHLEVAPTANYREAHENPVL